MDINIVCVGTAKDKFYLDACAEYSKRLKAFCNLNIKEVKESTTDIHEKKLSEEAANIFPHLKGYIIVLDIDGRQLSSQNFASHIENIKTNGASTITFVIGGSEGLSSEIKNKADYKLSFSPMTFPHTLFRVMLLEQVYRSFMITGGRKYHK